jgi:hypothetical protein
MSKLRWLKLRFDFDFNPVLWLADDSISSRLQEQFELAVVCGPETQDHNKIMSKREISAPETIPEDPSKWSDGEFKMAVERGKGVRGKVIRALNLDISGSGPAPSWW